MGLELIDYSKNFELVHSSGAKFVVRHWTNGMQDEVNKRCLTIDQESKKMTFDGTLERDLQIEMSVIDWSGITFDGQEVPCNSENKKKLPMAVALWLQTQIEERAGLRFTQEEKKN
jgi:hypothetical protein